ncbi:Ankyrin repeat [Singulisphaera sp. GP187]|uniref:ankyrin repeat domain-containing protein n=1 Tax=Singulisphaera sp. GP187 TaxID=1882752 RepID=UPI00092A41FA|nr:ankyrin repeat domain-containing protein [Singulisphaera sp. GP187]SIO61328.1 Ankyrin repeat [Singulisphaera sp. GP187]
MILHDAARCGDAATIRDLIDAGASAEVRDDEGRTPLLLAAEAGHLAAVRALVEAGAEVDAPALPPGEDSNDPPAEPILPVVCRRGLIDRVWPLLYGQATVRERRKGNPDGPTPLMTAAAAGHEAVVAWLLAAGADVNRRDRDGFTALAYAAAFDHAAIVHALIRTGADLDPVGHYHMRPVGVAALLGQAGAVRALVEARADLTAVESWPAFSPLHLAVRYSNAETVRALLAASADTRAKFLDSRVMEMAFDRGQAEIITVLVTGGADLAAEDSRRLTPLLRAVAKGDRAGVHSLLAAGADPNCAVTGKKKEPYATQALPGGATALHLAACREEPEFVVDLLAAGADPTARDSLGFTPLALVLASGNAEAARRLRSAAPPAEDEESLLLAYELVAAVRRGDEPAVRELLAAGVDSGATIPDTFKYHYILRCEAQEHFGDFDPYRDRGPGTFGDAGRSVLALAIERGHDAIANALMAAGAPTAGAGGGRRGEVGKIPLAVAAREGRRDVAAALLMAGADPNALDDENRTPLFHAAGTGHAAIVRDLIAAGAKVNLKDRERGMPLRDAAAEGHADCVRALLEAGAIPRPHDLSLAAMGGHVEAALVLHDALSARGIELEPQTLTMAVWSGSDELVRRLLDEGFDPSARDEHGTPALATACHKALGLVQLLLDAGADPNATDREGSTPIALAVMFGGPAVLRLLLERGASPEGRPDGVTKGETPLIRLAGNGTASMVGWHKDPDVLARAWARDREMIGLLLDHGADVEARDQADGRTALMHAVEKGHEDIVRALLDAGAEVDARDERNGRTALHWATQGGRAGAVELLIAAGADPLAADGDGLTPEAVARRAGHEALARVLRAKTGDRPRGGRSMLGVLRKAIEAGDATAVQTALEAGADVNARLAGKKTPLLLAAERGSVVVVETLLVAGADPNVRDADDATPLLMAIEAKGAEVVRLLLRAGADPDTGSRRHGNEERETPLMVAIGEASRADENALHDSSRLDDEGPHDRGTLAIVRALVEAGAAVDREDDCGNRPLWYALDLGQPEIACLLVEAGAGRDFVSAAYLKARTLARAARAPGFRAQVEAFAGRYGLEPQPWTDRPTRRDFQRMRQSGELPTGPTIGAQFHTTRDVAEALLAEQEDWRRRGAFPVRTSCYGDDFDFERQTIGLLPTDDPYVVIAAVCGPGTDWGWVCPAFTIRDLKAMERDYPFTLIGCESHSLELQFAAPVADPVGLARRLGSIRTHLGGSGLSEYPDDEEVADHLAGCARIGFYWE